jgi:hypothetical protein
VNPIYRCHSCGATWLSEPKGEASERTGRCLRCDGVLSLDEQAVEDPGPADNDVLPPVPNGLEDD